MPFPPFHSPGPRTLDGDRRGAKVATAFPSASSFERARQNSCRSSRPTNPIEAHRLRVVETRWKNDRFKKFEDLRQLGAFPELCAEREVEALLRKLNVVTEKIDDRLI